MAAQYPKKHLKLQNQKAMDLSTWGGFVVLTVLCANG
jgi:hypothetical protein